MTGFNLYCADCTEVLKEIDLSMCVCVCDPPFNIGYHYNKYKDSKPEDEYLTMLANVFGDMPTAVVLYPEIMHKLTLKLQRAPDRVVSWVYNSNTAKQHRDIAFYGLSPDFNRVRQPYKNPNDKRIQQLIASGKTGAKLYDWWNVNQVKNVSKVKTEHPCQMPLEVMENIIGIIPDGYTVIDPFMGSGTTGVACAKYGRDFIGVEIDEKYYKIACGRIQAAYEKQVP